MYRVLINYGTEGWQFLFDDPEHKNIAEVPTVDDAVKLALKNTYGNEFLIVRVIDWVARAVG